MKMTNENLGLLKFGDKVIFKFKNNDSTDELTTVKFVIDFYHSKAENDENKIEGHFAKGGVVCLSKSYIDEQIQLGAEFEIVEKNNNNT